MEGQGVVVEEQERSGRSAGDLFGGRAAGVRQ
jgi:hypothetical protein